MAKNTASTQISAISLGTSGVVTVSGVITGRIGDTDLSQGFAKSYSPKDDISDLPQKLQDILLLWWDDEVTRKHEELTQAAAEANAV